MRTGIGPSGPGIVRFSTLATSSPAPLSSARPAAASRASAGDISFSGGMPELASCSSRPAAAGSRGMSITSQESGDGGERTLRLFDVLHVGGLLRQLNTRLPAGSRSPRDCVFRAEPHYVV